MVILGLADPGHEAGCVRTTGASNPMHEPCAGRVCYLGPAGTFTHQAALELVPDARELVALGSVPEVFAAVETSECEFGVVAWDNTVEGPVFATLDGLLHSADVIAVAALSLPIQFDAYALAGGSAGSRPVPEVQTLPMQRLRVEPAMTDFIGPVRMGGSADSAMTNMGEAAKAWEIGTGHPHALAQVSGYLREHGLAPEPASSNVAAINGLRPGQIAFGPPGQAKPGVEMIASNVGDYPAARTEFLLLSRRDKAGPRETGTDGRRPCHSGQIHVIAGFDPQSLHQPATWLDGPSSQAGSGHQSLLAITPTATGPGVLARITGQFAQRGLNMSALVSRPLKGRDGQYVFVVTLDAPPWAPPCRALLTDLLASGDAVKTMGVWQVPAAAPPVGAVEPDAIPPSSARGANPATALARSLLW